MLQEVTINVFFFFQAEDGIRDHCVTGVQTCALPIWPNAASMPPVSKSIGGCWAGGGAAAGIGRASCRERVEISVVAVSLKKKNKKAIFIVEQFIGIEELMPRRIETDMKI